MLLASSVSLAAAADLRLVDAVKSRNAEAVQALLKQRVDVNAPQGDGATALHWAVHFDDLRIADLLIRAGARVNAANDTGVTPLFLACTNRNAAMVERLLAADANPNAALLNGETVLMTCSRTGEIGAGEGAAGARRQRQRQRAVARPDRADVGGGTEASAAWSRRWSSAARTCAPARASTRRP